MKGKAGLVIGLAAGYVLGSRAGRERFEQIKEQALKVWNMDPVQEQVGKVKEFAKSSAMALPTTAVGLGREGHPRSRLQGHARPAARRRDEGRQGSGRRRVGRGSDLRRSGEGRGGRRPRLTSEHR